MSISSAKYTQYFEFIPDFEIPDDEDLIYPNYYFVGDEGDLEAPEQKGLLRTAFDMGEQIFKLFGMMTYFILLIFVMLLTIEPYCVQITKWCWSVLIFVFGIIWWPLYTVCELFLSKIEG